MAHGAVISLFVAHYNNVSAFEIWTPLNPLPAYLALALPGYVTVNAAVAFGEATQTGI